MKKISAYMAALIFILTTNVCPQTCKALLSIETKDNDHFIFIDDVLVEKGMTEFKIELGKHIIKVKESLTKWNAEVITDTIDILDCGKKYSFKYDFYENVLVDTRPQNVEIIYKDSIIGFTPGYVEIKSLGDIKFKMGSTVFPTDYDLLHKRKIQQLDFEPVTEKTSFTNSDLFKVLVGSAVVLGGAAAYFKIQADNKYDDYLISKDKSALNEIDKLDMYSGISLGLLQINIGYLIYRFLTD